MNNNKNKLNSEIILIFNPKPNAHLIVKNITLYKYKYLTSIVPLS